MDRSTTAARQEWRDVVARLDGRGDELTAPELGELATAHWWLCEIPETIAAEERRHARCLADGDVAAAALVALRVGLLWGTRGDLSVAKGWLERANRLLRDLPECVAHGYATYISAGIELDLETEAPGAPGAADAARRLHAMAQRWHDRTLECFALTLTGMVAVRSGDLDGFAALDEAMVPVLGGQVDPLWGGDIFCSVIHLCEALGDLGRMRAWTDALEDWATPLSETFLYAGVTRIHQLQLLRAEGEWDLVERELGERSAGLADAHGWLAGAGFYELGEVHRLRGRGAEARAAYDRARALGVDPQPGEALLLHADGQAARALDALLIGLAGAGLLARARLLPSAVEIALVTGDRGLACRLADEAAATASRFGTPGLAAAADRARAACLADEGCYAEAIERLEAAARVHRRQRERHEVALVHEALAALYRRTGDDGLAAGAEATARAIFTALGAAADLARLDRPDRRELPAGLTEREVDVLVRVAAGRTNKEVAADLVISDKTVGRHLSNVFLKTGATSRTGAAAWAREHGLV